MNGELLRELPLPQRIAVSYAPKPSRPVTIAMLALDNRLAAVVSVRREPIAAQLRLAWWRERLAQAPGTWPRGEPVLDALRDWRQPKALVPLVDGWEGLLVDTLDSAAIEQFANARADAWLAVAGEQGCAQTDPIRQAARLWTAGDLAAHLSNPAEKARAVDFGRSLPSAAPLPRVMRPLAVLAGLARGGLDAGGEPLAGSPGALFRALRTGLTGR